MSITYRPLRRTSLANPSVTLDAPAFTKNPTVAKMIGAQNGALIHEAGDRLETVAAHVASVGNYEALFGRIPDEDIIPVSTHDVN